MAGNMSLIGDLAKGLTQANILDLSKNLVVGYKFYVFVGAFSLGFNKVSGLEKAYNYESLQVGGLNDRVVLLKKPIHQSSVLTLEDGGMKISSAEMKLYFNSSPKEILILLCTSSGNVHDIITVSNAVISKVSISPLDAQRSQLVVNTIEMTYTDFQRLAF